MALAANCRLFAQSVGDVVRLSSNTSSAGVPLHPAPGDRHYSRLPNGSVATVSAIDRDTGWYEVSIGGPIGWVIQMYMTVLRPPTISNLPDQTIDENSSVGPLSFTVADPDTALASLTLKATSSNVGLVSPQSVIFGGSDGKRTFMATPATNQFGTATITVTVSDGLQTASDQFTIVVRSPKRQLHLTVPEVAAAVLVFRTLTFGIQIPLGGFTYLIWRAKTSWLKPVPADAAVQSQR